MLDISTLENRSKTTYTRHRRDPILSQAKYTDIPTINGTNTNQRNPSIPSRGAWLFFSCSHTQPNAAGAFLPRNALGSVSATTSLLPERCHDPCRRRLIRLIRPAPVRFRLDGLGVKDASVHEYQLSSNVNINQVVTVYSLPISYRAKDSALLHLNSDLCCLCKVSTLAMLTSNVLPTPQRHDDNTHHPSRLLPP